MVFVSYYGHPLKDDEDKKREEIKLIARYLAGTGHPYVIGGISTRTAKSYRTCWMQGYLQL